MPSLKFVKTFGRPKPAAAPEGLKQLKAMAGDLGQAAAERAEWTAVAHWLNSRPEAQRDPVAHNRQHQAIIYYMQAKSAQSNIPSSSGEPIEAAYLGFHRSRQSRIKRTAEELLSLWKEAGEPWLAQSIRQVSDYMESAKYRAELKAADK